MTLSTAPYKGTRDFYPEDLQRRNYIFQTWKKTMLESGFSEYDSSIVESSDLYLAKSGEELGSKQLYSFVDKGDRKIALRPEMTPSLARLVCAKFGELQFPIRWFSIPNCFRYERPQKGRSREFWQLNLDIIGSKAGASDLEILYILGKIFLSFGAKKEMFSIRYGHRGLLDKWINTENLEVKKELIYKTLDEWHKIAEESRSTWMTEIGLNLEEQTKIGQFVKHPPLDLIKDFPDLVLVNQQIRQILPDVEYIFDTTIVRGIAYYTGLVFEAFDHNPENNRALFGGGRYDNLLDLFGKSAEAVGVGIGDLTWDGFLDGWNLWPEKFDNLQKVGILASGEDKLNQIYTETIPKILKNGKTYEINYEFDRSENKRWESLKKRNCEEIIKL
jgi:histidyl-tRNA synthetase